MKMSTPFTVNGLGYIYSENQTMLMIPDFTALYCTLLKHRHEHVHARMHTHTHARKYARTHGRTHIPARAHTHTHAHSRLHKKERNTYNCTISDKLIHSSGGGDAHMLLLVCPPIYQHMRVLITQKTCFSGALTRHTFISYKIEQFSVGVYVFPLYKYARWQHVTRPKCAPLCNSSYKLQCSRPTSVPG